jgi:signal transduction histidine kinase
MKATGNETGRRCEKMAALGTLTAGLMHELHNPGAAALRASSQLRENLHRLQEISLRFSAQARTAEQLECMNRLLASALRAAPAPTMSSIEQADAEESMEGWLGSAGVENAQRIAPALVHIGFQRSELDCARRTFDGSGFSDTLNWLEALISSATLVTAIEESITRISGLARSVKEFAHEDRRTLQPLDVHQSLQSALTLIDHKLREKQLGALRRFTADPALVQASGGVLSQIWINLLDNAIAAAPAGSSIEVATWNEAGSRTASGWLAIAIQDNGPGISAEQLPRIFDEFYTTKPQGEGSGLGLPIVRRLVTGELGGIIEVDSRPGRTRFLVKLPALDHSMEPLRGAAIAWS